MMKEITTSIHLYNAPQDFVDELINEAKDRNVSVLELLQSAVTFYVNERPIQKWQRNINNFISQEEPEFCDCGNDLDDDPSRPFNICQDCR